MATVYRAWDRRLSVHRAVKVLNPELSHRPAIRARFKAEARAMARLQHPNVVAIQDVIDDDGRIFIVMDLLDGGTAWQKVERDGPLSEELAVALVLPVVEAVGVAHAEGIVHRDIKPQNILLTKSGQPQLADFGIARFDDVLDRRAETRTGVAMGTWGFMPPEQRTDASRADARSDVYGLAATLWALVRGTTPTDLFAADLDDTLLHGFSVELAAVLRKATRYRPDQRFASAAELAQALRAAVPTLSAVPALVPARHAAPEHTSGTLVALLDPIAQPEEAATVAGLAEPVPPILDEGPPVAAPEPDPDAPPLIDNPGPLRRRPAGLAGAAILALTVALFAAAVGLSVVPWTGPMPEDGPLEPTLRPSPTDNPGMVDAWRPEPEEVTDPEPAVATVDPEPTPAPAPSQPRATRPPKPPPSPDPTPVDPEPVDPPPEAPAEANSAPRVEEDGQVIVLGAPGDYFLERMSDRSPHEAGSVPPGEYRLMVYWSDGAAPAVAANVTVEASRTVSLKCHPEFQKCKPQ